MWRFPFKYRIGLQILLTYGKVMLVERWFPPHNRVVSQSGVHDSFPCKTCISFQTLLNLWTEMLVERGFYRVKCMALSSWAVPGFSNTSKIWKQDVLWKIVVPESYITEASIWHLTFLAPQAFSNSSNFWNEMLVWRLFHQYVAQSCVNGIFRIISA